MFGSIISATDPVAVVALLKELGASKKLSTMIEGESLFNDGTAMVCFLVFLDMATGVDKTAGDVIVDFLRLALGGCAVGLAGGFIVNFWLLYIFNNFVLETNLLIFSSYLLFYVAEYWHTSGILAIVVFGIYMALIGRLYISPESEHANHHVWGYIGFIAETLIFMFAGLIMGGIIREDNHIGLLVREDFGKASAAFVILVIIRYICVFLFYPCLSRMGYGLTISQAVLVSYGGLRGAVGLCLAMVVHSPTTKLPARVKAVVLLFTSFEALFTLIVCAPTTKFVVNYFGLADQTELQKS
jgi:NhaP-type Na+/H+ or K+/H+ antiporter